MGKSLAGIDMVHVPYQGLVHALADLLGGQVQVIRKTPHPIVDKLHGALTRAVAAPDLKDKFATGGSEPMTSASREAYKA